MRKFIIAIMLFAPIVLMAQKGNFKLAGKIGNLDAPAKAYLSYPGTKGAITDSVSIRNGEFTFKGSITDPTRAILVINPYGTGLRNRTNERHVVYLESGTIQVNSPDQLSNAIITGSKINTEFETFMSGLRIATQKAADLYAEVRRLAGEGKKDESSLSEIQKKKDQIASDLNQVYSDYIRSHPNSYLSLEVLKMYAGISPEPAILIPLYNILSDDVKGTYHGELFADYLDRINSKDYKDKLENAKNVESGKTGPAFTQNDPDGNPVRLSEFRGKYVLIDFWASWCGPCRRENPNVVKAYANYHSRGFEILGVSLDTDKAAWIKAIKDDNLSWRHVSDLKGWENAVGVLYGIHAVPSNLLIDPNGQIIAKNLRGNALEAKLAEIFK